MACAGSPPARAGDARNPRGTWGCVEGLQVTGFLGFGHERSWSTFVVLVSSGEAWICADLIS